MTIIPPERHIIALPSEELEKFAREWALLKKGYYAVERFSGPGDMGRDVVGYIRQLLDAYGERDDCNYADHGEVRDHVDHGHHISMQRERFFEADAFTRFYRDNTMSEEIDLLRGDIFHGVADVHGAKHDDSLS